MTVPTTMKARSRRRRVRVSAARGTAAKLTGREATVTLPRVSNAGGKVAPAPSRPEDPMPRHLPVVLAALSFAPGVSGTFGLAAQSAADARWLADCRDRDDGWRVKHCEVRVSSLKATGGAVTVDPGKNGAVAIKGWDSDGVEVHARTPNGPLDIELTGARWDGLGLDAETTNGPVDLAIPDGYSAQLEFGTVNGPMTVGFPLTVTIQGRVGRRITTVLGKGGPTIRAVTANGPVAIRRN